MEVKIGFAEMSEYVERKFGKRVGFARVAEKVLRVTYVQRVFITKLSIPIELTIKRVEKDSVGLVYNGNVGVEMVIGSVLKYLVSAVPEFKDMIRVGDNRHVDVEINKIDAAKKALEYVELKDIRVLQDSLAIDVKLV